MDRALVAFVPASGGLAVGAAIWMLIAGHVTPSAVSQMEERLAAIPGARNKVPLSVATAFQALATPFFPSSAAGPVADVAVSLEGVSSFPGRTAALLSVNGAPAQWLSLGETRDGVALQEVRGGVVLLATAAGPRELVIGDGPAATVPPDTPPPGVRMPPAPASAPGAVQ